MSINGSEVLSQIERRHSKARDEVQARNRTLASLRDEHARANEQLRQAYQTLAGVRTQDASARRSALSEVDTWLSAQYAARQAEGTALMAAVEKALAASRAASDEARRSQDELDRAQAAWDGARQSMRDTLSQGDADFIAALQRQADAVRRSQAVDEHLVEMGEATDAFRKSCHADPLFAYCTKRRVGVAGCEGNAITRPLDRLVARLSGYYKHRQMLLDAEQDLEQWVRHQALLHAELSDARQQLESRVDAALRSPSGMALGEALSRAKAVFDDAKRRKAATANEHALLSRQLEEFEGERDPRAVQMRDRVLSAVASASDRDLARAAAETPDASDDRAAHLASTLRRALPDLEGKIARASTELDEATEQADRIGKLVSRFRSQGYDGRYSRFDYGFNADTLIAGVLMGQMSVSQAMGRFESCHRDVTPPPPPPPPSHDYGSSSSSGGFSSGGGFGGGGGFSTGGGF